MYQIFVVEDELLIRQNIREMVENLEGPYSFCGEASDGEMALAMMQDIMPDILLTDIKMPFLDGFELIRHVKAMIPWLKIIIISGYDEFTSAQKAISLGVDLYLLKPIRTKDLTEAIHKVARQLDENRNSNALVTGYKKDEVEFALQQHFMQQLLSGNNDTSQLLERATALGIDLVYPLYQVTIFIFESVERSTVWQDIVIKTLQENPSVLYYFNGSDKLVLLAFSKAKESLEELTYQLVKIIRHELESEDLIITTAVGNIVDRISSVKNAYNATDSMLKKVQALCFGQVIDINDSTQITSDIIRANSSFEKMLSMELLHATVEDVPDILNRYLTGAETDRFNSMLYRYNTLVDILTTAVQIVSISKPDVDTKDIVDMFSSEYDIFTASGKRDTFEKTAEQLLTTAISMKKENQRFVKHSHVISLAEEYLKEQFCDPNISLISVAKHIGMSSAHFSTIFSQATGTTFINYLTSLRIEKAKLLLAQTDLKLSAIAMEVGYNEPNYFSHVFKKHENMTPKDYRNNHSSR